MHGLTGISEKLRATSGPVLAVGQFLPSVGLSCAHIDSPAGRGPWPSLEAQFHTQPLCGHGQVRDPCSPHPSKPAADATSGGMQSSPRGLSSSLPEVLAVEWTVTRAGGEEWGCRRRVVGKLGLEGGGPGPVGAGIWGSRSAVGWAPPDRLALLLRLVWPMLEAGLEGVSRQRLSRSRAPGPPGGEA